MAQLVITPDRDDVQTGHQIAFTCSALDQYGKPIHVGDIEWSATGGAVTPQGLFTAGEMAGHHRVTALADTLSASAEIWIKTPLEKATTESEMPAPPSGKRTLKWNGTVPSQKWMNFYTKILSRFASSSDLSIEVGFEVTVDRDQADSKADDARSSLRELGIEGKVDLL